MGFKRPYDEEGLVELPLKHPKQVDSENKLTLFSEVFPPYSHKQKADPTPGEGNCGLVHDSKGLASYMAANKDFESFKDEEAGSPTAVCPVFSPERFESPLPRRAVAHPEDAYSLLLAGPPVKGVPIGPNHQAEIPRLLEKGSDHSAHIGDCVISSPSEMSDHDGVEVGRGRRYCLCVDQGSVRCVRLHVTEAREKLRETLGEDKFMGLGFGEMGEVVAQRWTEEEEWVFQKVVYSNPASLRMNFWEHLRLVFPSRTTKEIVSYYFNVFMLRRRGVQNRSSYLHSDSDDDEWQGNDDESGSLHPQVVGSNHEEEEEEEEEEDDFSEDDDDDDDDGGASSFENDSGNGVLIDEQMDTSMEDSGCEFLVNKPVDSDSSGSTVKTTSSGGVKSDDFKDVFHHGNGDDDYLLEEPLDAKLWLAAMSPLKCVDLLPPTGNIIDEIFGPCDKF